MIEKTFNDLAIFGGAPMFKEKLHVGRPNIGDREKLIERINDLLDRRWLTNNGPYVREFEQRIADFVKAKHCVVTCNGTIALEIAIRALSMTGEVIVPASTFIATAHALQWQEITPIFCDIDLRTYNMDVRRVEDMITPRTSGIIGVHLWGRTCDIDELTKIAERRGLSLLFDASHAFGCTHKSGMVGTFGDAEIFSFHATKFINTFEGGAVVTNDDNLAAKIRLMKNFGFHGNDNVIYIGTNGKMHEVSAAMGITSLESFDEFVSVNYDNYKQYSRELDDIPGISLMQYDEIEKSNYQYIVIEVDEELTSLTRDQFINILQAENIIARRYFFPGCHKMEPYHSYFPHASLLLPNTERFLNRVICLPTGTSVRSEDITKICNLIKFIIKYKENFERLSDE